MIKFTKIILEDCFAYEQLEFNFNSGIHSINGVNGASKTSVYLALAQGLFNKNPKGCKIDDVSNTVTSRPYEITIFFNKNGDKYVVVNSRKTGTIKVKCNGKDISKKGINPNLELIREILGDSYDVFVGSTYQASDSTLDLLEESGDTARKNFINKILKFDELDELLANNKAKLKRLTAQYKDKQDLLSQLRGSILPLREEPVFVDISKSEQEVELLSKAKDAAEWYKEEMAVVKTEAEFKRKAYWEREDKLAKLKKNQEELAAIVIPYIAEEVAKKELGQLVENIAIVSQRVKEIKTKLSNLKEPETVCSRCGHAVGSEQAKEIYAKDKSELTEDLDYNRFDLESMLRRQKDYELCLEEWYSINCYKASIKSLEDSLENSTEVIDEASYEATQQRYTDAAADYKSAIAAHSEALQSLNEACRSNDLASMVRKFNAEAEETNKSTADKILKLQKESTELSKRLGLLEHWVRILGPSGYRVASMKRFLEVLNQTMDKYSGIISSGKVKCNFFVTEEGKIDFKVVDPDKQLPFANWSKGEQARVKLACLFSVLDLTESMGSSSYNVLVLDEIFSALDEEGKEGLFKVLSYLRTNGKCIYTISHTPLVNPVVFDSNLFVVKEGGLARIE